MPDDDDKFMTDLHKRIKLLDAKLTPPFKAMMKELGDAKKSKDKKPPDLRITMQQYQKLFGKEEQIFNRDMMNLMKQYKKKETGPDIGKKIDELFKKATVFKLTDDKTLKLKIKDPRKLPQLQFIWTFK